MTTTNPPTRLLTEIIKEEGIKTPHELFEKHPEVWAKDYYFHDKDKLACQPEKACYACAIGAIYLMGGEMYKSFCENGAADIACINDRAESVIEAIELLKQVEASL